MLSTKYMLVIITGIMEKSWWCSLSRGSPCFSARNDDFLFSELYMIGGGNSADPINWYIKFIINISHDTLHEELG